MYSDRKRYHKNGYVIVEYPEHPKAFDTGTGFFGVYEHTLIAEEFVLDRSLKEGEVVHHLDKNRTNNSPDNLLVLSNPSHGKLHSWMAKHKIVPDEKQKERNDLGCVRCRVCEKPVLPSETFCSQECHSKGKVFKYEHPDKKTLEELVWSKPTTALAKEFGVSDKAVEKLCKKLEVEKPPRGYWTKKKFNKVE